VQAWDRHQRPARKAVLEPRRMRLGLY